jgi:hypothetical protein
MGRYPVNFVAHFGARGQFMLRGPIDKIIHRSRWVSNIAGGYGQVNEERPF